MNDARSTPPERLPGTALAGLSLCMLMPSLDTSIANASLPTLADALGASFQSMQWIVLAYLVAITAVILSTGRLGDIVGRQRVLLAGIALFTLASLLCGVAPSLGLLIGARAIQGLGAAVMLSLAVAAVGDIVPANRTGSAMGLLGTMSAVGTTLGPSLGGLLVAAAGWRSIFLVNVPIGIVAYVLSSRSLPRDRPLLESTRHRLDRLGTALLAIVLSAYALGATVGHGQFGFANIVLLGGAAAGAALFIRVERRAASPLVSPTAFSNGLLRASLATSALVSTVVMTTLVVGPFYLTHSLRLTPALVGLTLSVGPLVAALTGVPAGRVVDRVGAARTTIVGLAGIATGCCALSLLPAGLGIAGYVVPVMVLTSGYALFQAANNTAAMTALGPAHRGMVSGALNLSRNLGLITGASSMGAVFALLSARGAAGGRATAAAGAMRGTFAIAAILTGIALVIAARRRPPARADGRQAAT